MQGQDLASSIWYIILNGMPMTLLLTFFGLSMGFVIGLVLALVRVYGAEELGWLADAYEKILRGIPVYILMFILAFGLGWNLFTGVAIALGIRSGAYQSQIIRGAILSVDPQQLNAARSIGMTQSQAARHIILPQAFRLAIPSWSNEYAVIIKDTAFAAGLGIPEMFYAATRLYYGDPALFLLATVAMTIIYFLLTYPLTRTIGEAQAAKLRQLGLGGG